MAQRIGIMQGRLVPPVDGQIQAFPAARWSDEFPAARQAGLQTIEWIYDTAAHLDNPVATAEGIARLRALSRAHGVEVVSLCADYFMAEPLLRGTEGERGARRERLDWLIGQCHRAGIGRMVLPFVDHSRIEGEDDFAALAALLREVVPRAMERGIEIHLESSLPPLRLAALLDAVDHPFLKVNYDSGNSASLGYRVDDEFDAYGDRIGSVHIKDRVQGGTTVPLGEGDADFPALFRRLRQSRYAGDYILQVARAVPGDETAWAIGNRATLAGWLAHPAA